VVIEEQRFFTADDAKIAVYGWPPVLPSNIPMNEIPLISYYLYSLYGGDIETSLNQEQSYFLCFPKNRKNIYTSANN
jgi:hypothetical protein